jgi:hypothetical protein
MIARDREQAVIPDSIGAYSSVWLERTPDKREVGGSNPPRPTIECCESAVSDGLFEERFGSAGDENRPEAEAGIRSGSEQPTERGAQMVEVI